MFFVYYCSFYEYLFFQEISFLVKRGIFFVIKNRLIFQIFYLLFFTPTNIMNPIKLQLTI